MPIAGVVILTDASKTMDVLEQLNHRKDITTYGVHKDIYIVAVFETDSLSRLEQMSRQITDEIPVILSVYPAYVHFGEEE